MKSQKGITLTSLLVYIIGMLIIISIIAVVSGHFYTDMNNAKDTVNPLTEYTKFNSFFTDEANHDNIKVIECKEDYIVFDNGVQYTFIKANKGIYRNKVKICSDVVNCTFENKIQNGKNVVIVRTQIGTGNERKTTYTLKK